MKNFKLNQRQEFLDKLKSRGVYYTPESVCQLVKNLVLLYKKNKIKSVYDPTCGSGMLLASFADDAESFFGQEIDEQMTQIAVENLKQLTESEIDIQAGDTLVDPKHKQKFDVVVANPPYSAKWTPPTLDPRFFGIFAPKSKADYAFIQHIIWSLLPSGMAVVVAPNGVLFRGGSEEKIRRALINDNLLDAVIGLPANLFNDTSIPVTILIFDKARTTREILFIDASKDFKKAGKQNTLKDEHIDKIVQAVKNRKEIERFCHIANLKEIQENEYNLNIPRYVDTFEPEPEIDIDDVSNQIQFGEFYDALVNKRLLIMSESLHPQPEMPFMSDEDRVKLHTKLSKIKTIEELQKFEKKLGVDSSQKDPSGSNTLPMLENFKKGLIDKMFI